MNPEPTTPPPPSSDTGPGTGPSAGPSAGPQSDPPSAQASESSPPFEAGAEHRAGPQDPAVEAFFAELEDVESDLAEIKDPRPESDRLHAIVSDLISERRRIIADIDQRLGAARERARTYLNEVCVPTEGRRERLRLRADELRKSIERHLPKR